MGFKEDIAAAKVAPAPSLVVPIELNGKPYKLKFTKMLGSEYAAETLLHEPNVETSFGREYGYDIHSLSRAVAPRCGVLLDGKVEETLSVEEWADLFLALDGGAHEQIANTIFQLNEYSSAKAVAAARKVLDGTAVSSLLRSVSGSRPVASKGGSLPSSTSESTKDAVSSESE